MKHFRLKIKTKSKMPARINTDQLKTASIEM